MSILVPNNTSQTARLMLAVPEYAVGWQELIYVPNPAAGAGWVHVVDGRYWERLLVVSWELVTDAVVANRVTGANLVDQNGVLVASAPSSNAVAASKTVTPVLMQNAPAFGPDTSAAGVGWLPDLLIPPGWKWESVAGAYDAGDQESNVTLLVQRFPNDVVEIAAGG